MRAAQAQAQSAGQQAGATGQQLMGQAGQISQPLTSQLTQQMQAGLTPQQLNNLQVGAQQESGGALSGVQGAADLQSMRARNAGGFGMSLDEAARQKMRQDAQSNLNIQQYGLGRQMQAEQLGEKLYGTQLDAAMRAYGLQGEDIRNEIAAGQTGWFQNMTGLIGALRGSGATKGPLATAGAYGI
jgi:hypothetical protein